MLALRLNGIDFSYGQRRLFSFGHLVLYSHERVGLVGSNGSGKSTLLDIIAGLSEPSAGKAEGYLPISYFTQSRTQLLKATPEMLSRFNASEGLANPSGGEITRLKLASAFSPSSGLLILDEPTTNLDMQGISALREAMSFWEGPVIMVTHDAALMAETCDRIWKIKEETIVDFPGGYSEWIEYERQSRQSAGQRYEEYLRKRRHLLRAMNEALASSKTVKKTPSRMGNSEARLHKRQSCESSEKLANRAKALHSRLDRLEPVLRPRADKELSMAFARPKRQLPKFVAAIRDLNMTAGEKVLLMGASLDIPTGAKSCLVGPNGCGKTTLINKLADWERFQIHKAARIGILKQDLSDLDESESGVRNCTKHTGATEQAARTVLARLRIRNDMALVPVGSLSGGERMKVALARLMLSDSDLLLLDEPSNHMDLESVEALSQVLAAWPGTLFMASHDRALIDSVADRLVIWNGKKLESYEGNWSDYEQARLYTLDASILAESMKRAEDAFRSKGTEAMPIIDA